MKKVLLYLIVFCTSVAVATAQSSCIDSSITKAFHSLNGKLNFTLKIPTNDNGILINIFEESNTVAEQKMGIAKINASGNIEWTRSYIPTTMNQVFAISHLLQLQDGSYVIGGKTLDKNSLTADKIILIKLNENGNAIWQKQLNNNYGSSNQAIVRLTNLQEGKDGDVIIFSTDQNGYVDSKNIVTRLNTNGQVVWSNAYFGNAYLIEPVANIVANDSKLHLWAKTINASNCFIGSEGLCYLQLDYSTGMAGFNKHFCISPGKQNIFLHSTESWLHAGGTVVKKLINGNSIVVLADAIGARNLLVNLFDSNYNFIKSTLYQTGIPLGPGQPSPTFWFYTSEKNGEVVFNMSLKNHGDAINLPFQFYSFLDSNLNLTKQIFVQENNTDPVFGSAIFLKNGALNFTGISQQILNPLVNQMYFSNTLSGASSDAFCNAKDSIYGSFEPHGLTDNGNTFQYDSVKHNVYNSADSSLFTITSFNLLETNNCKKISICDSLKLIGSSKVCLNINDTILYTAYKNPQCLKEIEWSIDTSYATLIETSDTTRGLLFKKEGQCKLFISLKGCVLKDSILIEIVLPKTMLSISGNASLCPGTTSILYATKGFKHYEWSNATSADSLIITSPGFYKLTGADDCGNIFKDSLYVGLTDTSIATQPKNTICLLDTLTILLPASVTNITWQPSKAIIWQNNLLKLYPDKTTHYSIHFVFSDKCLVQKSVQVNVETCPETVYFPNSFTPNNDGLNDIFRPAVSRRLAYYQLAVFNRYGQKIFETHNQDAGWNGLFKNQPQKTGTFIWQCSYQFANKPVKSQKGAVLLLR